MNSERVNMSNKILEKHYDKGTNAEKAERRRDSVKDILLPSPLHPLDTEDVFQREVLLQRSTNYSPILYWVRVE